MKMHYDRAADARYIAFADSRVIASESLAPGIVLDLDASNAVVAIEVLGLRRRLPEADPTGLQIAWL